MADANFRRLDDNRFASDYDAVTGEHTPKVKADVVATAEMEAEATDAAPSYTEGQDAPISQTRNGELRVDGIQPTTDASTTAGVASAQLLAADATRKVAWIQNVHATNMLGIAFTAAAALNVAGTIMLAPYSSITITGLSAQLLINAIATGAASPVTVRKA